MAKEQNIHDETSESTETTGTTTTILSKRHHLNNQRLKQMNANEGTNDQNRI